MCIRDRICQFSAIVTFGTTPLVFPEMCHGCGGCTLVCPPRAITEQPRRIGVVETSQAGNITLVTGRLDVGVALAPPLIKEVRKAVPADRDAILDAPPGTCLLYTSPSPRDRTRSRMPSSA